MNKILHSIIEKTNCDFIKASKFSYFISVVLILLSVIFYFTQGLNLGIDFTGGKFLEIKSLTKDFNLELVRSNLAANGITEASVQHLGNNRQIVIKIKGDVSIEKIKNTLANEKVEYLKIDYVGSQVSSELIKKGIYAVLLALAGMFLYLLFRFNFHFAFSGVIALIHDILLIIGFFIITQMEFNIPSVAAILTIIGYSINDSVVIFDRIREYLKSNNPSQLSILINKAINTTLMRTTLTSFTTILATVPLIIIGKEALHDFSLAIFIGIIVGTYSSIFIAGPLLQSLQK